MLINDLVSFVDGEPINSIKAFNEYMKTTRPESVIRLEVRRGDNLQTIEVWWTRKAIVNGSALRQLLIRDGKTDRR